MRNRDLVIGAATNCSMQEIQIWCNSIDQSNFTGAKALVVYDVGDDVRACLQQKGYTTLEGNKLHKRIVVQRFKDIPELVSQKLGNDFRYIIATDVFDVVFQSNPSKWLETNLWDKKINVGSECIAYKDEDWGRDNLRASFGADVYDNHKDNIIYNAGTIAGEFDTMLTLFQDIYEMSIQAGTPNADQAALNVLIHTDKYKSVTNFATMQSGWCCQAGTVAHPNIVAKYANSLTEPLPVFIDGVCYTSEGVEFALVHQYNRVPEWREAYGKYK